MSKYKLVKFIKKDPALGEMEAREWVVDNPNCGCLFCATGCPECGSLMIDVSFEAGMGYQNEEPDVMVFHTQKIRGLKVKCSQCGKTFSGKQLKKLREALKAHLHFCLVWKKSGRIIPQPIPKELLGL